MWIKKETGFSLVELMVAVGIVGITAAIAIPAYQNHLVKAKVSESMQSIGPFQLSVAECYQTTGAFSGCSNNQNGIPESATATYGSITTSAGVIIFTFNSNAKPINAGNTVTFTPESGNATNALSWNCSSTLSSSYLPSTCNASGASAATPAASPTPTTPGTLSGTTCSDGQAMAYNATLKAYTCANSGLPNTGCPAGTTRGVVLPDYIWYCKPN